MEEANNLMEDGFITVQELSEILGIGINSTYDLIKLKGFPSIPIGSRLIIPKVAFLKWISDPDKIITFKSSVASESEQEGDKDG